MQMKSHLGIYDYVIFTFEKTQDLTFSTYLVMLPGNGKSDKSVTVVDITSTCNVFLLNF